MPTIHDVWIPAHRVILTARQRINQQLKPLGITSAEGNILLHLLFVDAQVCQEQLAEELGVSKAAISRVVDSLVAKGYVTRQKDASDKRVYCLVLTDSAREIAARVRQAYDDVYTAIAKTVSAADFDRLVGLLRIIADRFAAGT